MINRELIRLKVVQTSYSHYQKGGTDPLVAEKEMFLSLGKSYELYNYLLLLLVEIGRMALRMLEMRQNRSVRLGEETLLDRKFVDNPFIHQLTENIQLKDFCEKHKFTWAEQEEFIRRLYLQIEESELYLHYMNERTTSYEDHRYLWRQIFREFIGDNEELDSILEDYSIYWNDDRMVVDTFVLKTINLFQADSTPEQPLLPEYGREEDREYASKLIRNTIENENVYRDMLGKSTRRWDIERVALMDRVIMQVALAEIVSFPSIPVSASINEYVEIAKYYCAPKSSRYVNATLDTLAKQLQSEHKIVKDNPEFYLPVKPKGRAKKEEEVPDPSDED